MTSRRILFAAFAILALLVLGGFVAYPLYPSPMPLCGLAEAREKNSDRWASPHRGAVVLLTGDLYGLPDGGVYAFRCRCKGYDLFIAVQPVPVTMQSFETRKTLHDLTNPDWRTSDRYAPFTIAARVDSEMQTCFGPPMVLTALTMQSRGPLRIEPRRKKL